MVETKFKQTEIGLIPEDWEVKVMIEIISDISMGPFGSDIKVSNFVKKGVPVLNGYNISGIKLKDRYSNFVTTEKAKSLNKAIARRGDIVVTHRGTIGQIAYIPIDSSFDKYVISQSQFRFSINKAFALYKYIVMFFHSDKGQKIISEAKGHTGVPAIAQATTTFKHIQIPLPPLPEQQAIAEVLNDTDAWIEAQEKLIAKKRHIKQGAMQELLTPKEGWEELDFNKVVWFQEGPGLRNWQFTKSGIKVINVTNLENGYLNLSKTERYISIYEFEKMYKHFLIDENDIVVASSGNSYGKISIVRKQDLPLLMNTSVIRFKTIKGLDYLFLLTFLKSNYFKEQIDLLITGGAQPNFGPAHLNKMKIWLPKSLAEQTRIATILSDMDAEIEALEAKLAKTRQLKQGMMQELLTGRIRLVSGISSSNRIEK